MLNDNFSKGFDGIGKKLSDIISQIDKKEEAIADVADMYVSDIRKLPKPKSRIHTAGYTHLIDSIGSRKKNGVIEVGWGKYYGPMVESGTIHANAKPHLAPTWYQNKEKYIDKLKSKFGL